MGDDDAIEGRKDAPMIDAEMPETSETRVAAPPAAEISQADVLGEDGGDAIFVKELPKVTASLVVASPTAESSMEGGFDQDGN